MKIVDLRPALKGYTSKWVLLSKDYKKVIESAKTLPVLLKKIRGRDGIIMSVAKDYSRYIGSI